MCPISIDLIIIIVKVLFIIGVILTGVAYYTYLERRIGGWIQDRVGPNRAGPLGLLQPLADGIKFFFKEDVIPLKVDKPLYVIAPALSLVPALITFAVVPFGNRIELFGHVIDLRIADINIGILYVFAVAGLGVYGIILAGWSSNNKYALLGSLRAAAQVISYELAMGLSIVGVLLVYETLNINQIVVHQGQTIGWLPFVPRWGVFVQPLGFLIFLIAAFAETNRTPFDLPEGEAEIVAGYHVEYGSLKFACFFMAEYSNMITSAAIIATLFFGGWQVPYSTEVAAVVGEQIMPLLQVLSFLVKTVFFAFLFIWVRWTLPRFRYDQLMNIGWKILLPAALANVLITAAIYVVKYA